MEILEIKEVNWHDWDIFDQDSVRKMAFFYSLRSESKIEIQYADQIKILDIDGIDSPDLLFLSPDSSSFDMFLNYRSVLQPVLHASAKIIELSRKLPLNPVQIVTANFDSINYEYLINTYTSFVEDGIPIVRQQQEPGILNPAIQ